MKTIKAHNESQTDRLKWERYLIAALINSNRTRKDRIKVTDLIRFSDERLNIKKLKVDQEHIDKMLKRWDEQAAKGIMKYDKVATGFKL